MDSKTYWEKREQAALEAYIKDEAEYSKELDRIYADMLDSVQKEIDSFYQKYAASQGITLAEAKKRVEKHDVKAFERRAARYVKDKDFSKKANEELKLYNATMRINRLEMLKANIGLETIKGHAELERFMEGILKGRTMEELERQAGILGKTVRNNAKMANAIVNGSFKVDKVGERTTFSDRIWQYHDEMKNELSRLLSTGLIQGKNSRAIAKDLKKYWYGNDPKTNGGARYCMERLMRTEMARVQTEAQKQSFVRNGFEMYTFHANRGCCDICSKKDGKHFSVKDMMPGENAPPMHPHCRCSTSAYEDSKEYEAWLDHLANGGTTEEWNKIKYSALKESKPLENSANYSKINIDELTPCLRRLSDGKIVQTTVVDVKPTKKAFFDWEFDWTLPRKSGFTVRGIKADGDDRIQGLVALKSDPRNSAVLVDVVEAAPFNNPHNKKFVKKEYSGVGGHLFAEAVRESFEQGFEGYVYFRAKSDLIEHYQEELGAILINPRERIMAIEEGSAKKLYERYYKKE